MVVRPSAPGRRVWVPTERMPGERDSQVKERPSSQAVIVQTAFGSPGCSTV